MNSWNISGYVLKHGVKGTKYRKLWIQVELQCEKLTFTDKQYVFINFDLDDSSSKKGNLCRSIVAHLEKFQTYLFAYDVVMQPIQRSKLNDKNEWENYLENGLKGKIAKLSLQGPMPYHISEGTLLGKVIGQNGGKILLEQAYKLPSGGYKHRNVPVVLPENPGGKFSSLVGKSIFVKAKLSGISPMHDNIFALAETAVVL